MLFPVQCPEDETLVRLKGTAPGPTAFMLERSAFLEQIPIDLTGRGRSVSHKLEEIV
jgi:hypothetical protein